MRRGAGAARRLERLAVRLGDRERGSAVVEMLGGSLVLLLPLVYLVLTLAQLQSATFAAEGAARDVGRLLATSSAAQVEALAQAGVELAFADHGHDVDGAQVLTVSCDPSCSTSGAVAHVTVTVDITLPFVPDGLLVVPVTAEAVAVVDPYRERP